jgi:hypothetical protein
VIVVTRRSLLDAATRRKHHTTRDRAVPVYHLRRAQHVDTAAARGTRAIARASDGSEFVASRSESAVVLCRTGPVTTTLARRRVDLTISRGLTDSLVDRRMPTRLAEQRSNDERRDTSNERTDTRHYVAASRLRRLMPEATARVHELSVNHQLQARLNIGQ